MTEPGRAGGQRSGSSNTSDEPSTRPGPHRRPLASRPDRPRKLAAAASPAPAWRPAMELGPMGMHPWGDVQEGVAVVDGIPDVASPQPRVADGRCRPISKPRRTSATSTSGLATPTFISSPTPTARDGNTCTFRVSGKSPEFWSPDTGHIQPAAAWNEDHGTPACRCDSIRAVRCSSSSGKRPPALHRWPAGRTGTISNRFRKSPAPGR